MNNLQIKAGSTDISVVIRIIDSTDGTPEIGVVYNTSGIDLEYRREGAASTDITEASLAALTTAHTDGGFLHIGNGYYRLDLPDAAVAAGATGVLIHGTVTGMVVIGCYIQLVAYNPFDAVRLGLTALPNAAADAAGGLVISDAGGLDIDDMKADINTIDDFLDTEIAAILAAVDTEIAAIKAVTDLLNTAQAEPTGAPAVNETPLDKLAYLFMALRNKLTVTSTAKNFFDDGGSVEWSKALSDDGTTYTEAEGA